ncbi:MAG: thiamine pyrophosphate-dependent enzyme, partial [Ktedonobacterales bacterium]
MAEAVDMRRGRSGAEASHPADPIAAMLDDEGRLTAEAEREVAISNETLRDLYRLMVICRRLDQEGLNLQRQGELGLWGPYAGHEAAQVGAAQAMQSTDWIFPYYRDFAMAICRGIDPGAMMTIFRGLTHGAWNPHDYRFGPFVIPV